MGLDKSWTSIVKAGTAAGWGDLISFRPADWVQNRLAEDDIEAEVQAIEDAWGEINLDYYPVVIRRFPINEENWHNKERHDAASLLELFRRLLVGSRQEKVLDTSISEFSPFSATDQKRWFGDRAEGSVLHIEMRLAGLNPDDGSVVCSHAGTSEFRVSTIWIGEDGYHPVTGNREWGVWRSGRNSAKGVERIDYDTGKHWRLNVDEWTFYTRGADRLSTAFQAMPGTAQATFAGGEDLWLSMQDRFAAFINDNGGVAWAAPQISQRLDWDDIKDTQFAPTTRWVEDTA
jgi:hypothetical protein